MSGSRAFVLICDFTQFTPFGFISSRSSSEPIFVSQWEIVHFGKTRQIAWWAFLLPGRDRADTASMPFSTEMGIVRISLRQRRIYMNWICALAAAGHRTTGIEICVNRGLQYHLKLTPLSGALEKRVDSNTVRPSLEIRNDHDVSSSTVGCGRSGTNRARRHRRCARAARLPCLAGSSQKIPPDQAADNCAPRAIRTSQHRPSRLTGRRNRRKNPPIENSSLPNPNAPMLAR